MMNNRETVILIGASLLVAGMLFFLLFEIKEVPDLQWKENYAYSSKQPFGTWVFHQMLKERFSEIPVLTNQIDTNLASIESDKVLYLMISDQVSYGDSNTTALMDFVRKGNDALLITTDLLLGVDDEPYSFYWREFADTTITVHYVNTDVAFTYTHYEDDFFKAKSKFFTAFSGELSQDLDHEALGTVADSLIFYDQWNLGKGHLMVHTVPEMFCNQAAVQDQYREHFNFLFSTFDPELVILDHMNYHAESDLSESPL
ncbi:MAG: DUF4350 domain-containing protein, partial [Saprospiraceae bacterium]|nr:DUF4350 domain-containing protein [Saprospiraceae bacterium]